MIRAGIASAALFLGCHARESARVVSTPNAAPSANVPRAAVQCREKSPARAERCELSPEQQSVQRDFRREQGEAGVCRRGACVPRVQCADSCGETVGQNFEARVERELIACLAGNETTETCVSQISSKSELTTAIDHALTRCMLECGYPEMTRAEYARPGVQPDTGGEAGVIPLGAILCEQLGNPCPAPKSECVRYKCEQPIFSTDHSYCNVLADHENAPCRLDPQQPGVGACKSGACVSQQNWPRACGGAVARYLGIDGWSYAFGHLECTGGRAPADCERDARSLLAGLFENVHRDLIQCLLRAPNREWGGASRVHWGNWPTERQP
jgi:hypothetical protein